MEKFPVVKAPEGAPNVLLILIDDSGFGQWRTFGGQIPTPNLDRLARSGLRYTRFHTTALCSPTRAALLTGRNHHSCGMGVITEMATVFLATPSEIPKAARVPGGAAPERLQHGLLREEPPDRRIGRPASPGRSTGGRTGRGSTNSMASSAGRQTSGSPRCTKKTGRSRWRCPGGVKATTR